MLKGVLEGVLEGVLWVYHRVCEWRWVDGWMDG